MDYETEQEIRKIAKEEVDNRLREIVTLIETQAGGDNLSVGNKTLNRLGAMIKVVLWGGK